LPGLALLAVAQHVVTGSAFTSAQSAYYAASDGPPGCFRYGFGRGVGCLIEHGDFVRAGLEGGFGPVAALFTTGRRLAYHLGDVANFEPLALLVLVPVFASRARGVRLAPALVPCSITSRSRAPTSRTARSSSWRATTPSPWPTIRPPPSTSRAAAAGNRRSPTRRSSLVCETTISIACSTSAPAVRAPTC